MLIQLTSVNINIISKPLIVVKRLFCLVILDDYTTVKEVVYKYSNAIE